MMSPDQLLLDVTLDSRTGIELWTLHRRFSQLELT